MSRPTTTGERKPRPWPRFDVTVKSDVPTPWGRYGPANHKRARWGRKVARRFARRKDAASMVDLICGLLHYAHQLGEDPATLLERVGRAFAGDFDDEEFRPGECSPILRRFDERDPRAQGRS